MKFEEAADGAEQRAEAGSESAQEEIAAPLAVVGIGASAGGLEALEKFFSNMPPDNGMAFVVVQHLSPDFKSLMDELLSRQTRMAIHWVEDGMLLERNAVYLIPPRTEITLRESRLRLTTRVPTKHLELPIDVFFHSLAEDARERAVAIVLSGTGSDGSRGIQSVHEAGGMVLVQSEESSKFNGMPRSAIETGVADLVLPPDEMPAALMMYLRSPVASLRTETSRFPARAEDGEYAEIFAALRQYSKIDFASYKLTTVGRRIARRMAIRHVHRLDDYAALLTADPDEIEALCRDLLIGVTAFFRDTEAFQTIEEPLLDLMRQKQASDSELRVWVAGCATGEEAYSIAILLFEKAQQAHFQGKITVFATDVHQGSLGIAASGVYHRSRLERVSPERLALYFSEEGKDHFRVTPALRSMIVFARHNLVSDPPFTKMDLVCCRNLLIYLQPATQERVISLFQFSLRTGALLFLGPSEGLGSRADDFAVIDKKWKIFRKVNDVSTHMDIASALGESVRAPASIGHGSGSFDRRLLHDYDALLRKYAPAGLLLGEERQVLHIFGDGGKYLVMPPGRVTADVLTLVEGDLRIALGTALQRAAKDRTPVTLRRVRARRDNTEEFMDLTVEILSDPAGRSTHFHVAFEAIKQSATPASALASLVDETRFEAAKEYQKRVVDLEFELQSTRENLQATIEELQTTNEELQAANEEMLASNEELQSTNEELQSVNEELYTVNAEYERKNQELKRLTDDLENLLNSTDIGIVFLDRELCIRRFTSRIAETFGLLPGDVGRPIKHIAYRIVEHEQMLDAVRRVAASGVPSEMEARTVDGGWQLLRITPYMTKGAAADGVVVSFIDITAAKRDQEALRASEERFRGAMESSLDAFFLLKSVRDSSGSIVDFQILEVNGPAERLLSMSREQLTGCLWREALPLSKTDPNFFTVYREVAEGGHPVEREFLNLNPRIAARWLRQMVVRVSDGIAVTISDISLRKNTEETLRDSEAKLRSVLENASQGIVVADEAGRIEMVNDQLARCFGYQPQELYGMNIDQLLPESLRELHSRHRKMYLQDPQPRPMGIGFELVGRRRDGTLFPIEVSLSSVHLGDRRLGIGFVTDITYRQQMEEQLRQSQKLEAIGRLAGGVAHDFNNLLTIIRGHGELLVQSLGEGNELLPSAREIARAADRATSLTTQLLAFSRHQAARPKVISLNEVVSSMENMLRRLIGEGVNLRTEIAPDLWQVKADPGQMEQILMNLAINSRDAMPGFGELVIRTANVVISEAKTGLLPECVPGAYVTVSVSDTGHGMDERTRARIFEPFFTTKERGKGTGLGLSMVYGIVRQSGGSIEVTSAPGRGATFTLYFPKAADARSASGSLASGDGLARGNETILLVEDEDGVRELTSTMLRQCGYTVLEASLPARALELFREYPGKIDLLLTDVIMPGMDGRALAEKLSLIRPGLRVLFMSGYTNDEVLQYGVEVSGIAFLQKPFTQAALAGRIREVLQ